MQRSLNDFFEDAQFGFGVGNLRFAAHRLWKQAMKALKSASLKEQPEI